MTGITRAPIQLVKTSKSGNVKSNGRSLQVEQSESTQEVTFEGDYDRTTGTLTLSVPELGTIKIDGFFTDSNLPKTQTTVIQKGRDGVDGTIGLDGRVGDTGCEGPQGPRGVTGSRGPRGHQGNTGATGATGATGEKGQDGKILVFVQDTDPGPVGAMSLWIKPTVNAL